MKLILFFYVFLSILFLTYLALPDSGFPYPDSSFLQSREPADVETDLRRGYFTDFYREENISHYRAQMTKGPLGILMPTIRLNYPPEEAGTIIRDQTRSTYLEEIVVPFRTSLFINGFEPKAEKDTIIVDDKVWGQKIIVKLIKPQLWSRLLSGSMMILLIPVLGYYLKVFLSDVLSLASLKRISRHLN